MRHTLLSVCSAAALGLGMLAADAISAPAAQAQGFAITVGSPYVYAPYPVPPRSPVYWHRPYPRPVYYRPAYGGGYGPDCRVRVNRYFDGYAWVTERRRTCW